MTPSHLTDPEANPKSPTGLKSRWGYRLLNFWIIFHLIAICAAPLSVEPASRLQGDCWRMVAPYLQALYLNHGFHFFAPNPGGANLIQYEVVQEDGTVISGRFPNRDIWPRLLYHRHFMLTEFLGSRGEDQEFWTKTYARHLCRRHQGDQVTLTAVWHDIPSQQRILAGGELTNQDLYTEEPLGTFTWDELSAQPLTE